jgi:hypothetical protein
MSRAAALRILLRMRWSVRLWKPCGGSANLACFQTDPLPNFHEWTMILLVELEDLDLYQLSDSQVLEAVGFHFFYEGSVDLEDAHLDKFFLGW